MLVNVYDIHTMEPVAVLAQVTEGSFYTAHNESGRGTIVVPAGSSDIAPLITDASGRVDIEMVLSAPSRYFARARDSKARLLMQGRIVIEPSEDGESYTVTINDMLDELRLIGLPPQRYFSGFVVDILVQMLNYVPRSVQVPDVVPPSDAFFNERWRLANVDEALNAWTTVDASNMTCLEAIITACENTSNSFCLNPDGTRSLIVYHEPAGSNRPVMNLVKSGFHATVPASTTAQIISNPVMVVEDDTVLAGIYPEGGSYTALDNVSRALRLSGDEDVPDGYRLENVNGYWGIFNEELVDNPVFASMPLGQIRSEVFSSILPFVNTEESISAIVESSYSNGRGLISAAFDGYPNDYWKDGKARFGDNEAVILQSVGNAIGMENSIGAGIGDIVSVSVFREWSDVTVSNSMQSLAGASVALLESHSKAQASWNVRSTVTDVQVNLGHYVRVIFSGAVRIRNTQSNVDSLFHSLTINGVFVVAKKTVAYQNGIETQELVLTDRMWRFPSGSGIRELTALIQRRMSGATMGEGSTYVEQYIVPATTSGGCSLGFSGTRAFSPAFASAPTVLSVQSMQAGVQVSATVSPTTLAVCARQPVSVRVTIVPTARV